MAPKMPTGARSRLAGYNPPADRLGALQSHIGHDMGIGAVSSRFPYDATIGSAMTAQKSQPVTYPAYNSGMTNAGNDAAESLFYGHIDGGMYDGCPCRACAFCRAVPELSGAGFKPLTCENIAGDPASATGQTGLSDLARKSLLKPQP